MSRAAGQIKFKDGMVLHFVYNGTVDACYSKLFKSLDDAYAAWDDESLTFESNPTLVEDSETVEIAVNYGNGSSWDGSASRSAMLITEGLRPNRMIPDPDDPFGRSLIVVHQTTSGLPDWFI